MATSEVKLLGTWSCPYVNRAQLALKLKSVEYEFVEDIPYKKSEILLKYNPVHKKIPVLVHDEKPVCESLIIVQYIEDAWPASPSFLPSDAYDRAQSRFWADYIDTKWYPLLKVLRQSEEKEQRTTLIQKVSEGLLLLEEIFIKCSKGKPYFGGENIGYLDIVLGSTLRWLEVTGMVLEIELLDLNKTPKLARWARSFCSDHVVEDVLPETQKLLELNRKIQDFIKAGSKWN
ncbi:glutathione S-transferase U17-like [Primulina huaijiensis]|uniref:glutathione S-transferase U17-like n=1 Tax=Primulina huaijiensis TaxID=1492673 RepID=UPI003CC714BC